MGTRKPSYTPIPRVPQELMPRLAAIIEVLAGATSVSEAARSLGMSRNHFQTILHRALAGAVQSITRHVSGRPARSRELTTLRAELARQKRQNARLQTQVASTQHLLTVAGGLLQGRVRASGRRRRLRSATESASASGEDGEPDAQRQRVLDAVDEMCRHGVTRSVAAHPAGVHPSTLRRWRAQRAPSACTRSTAAHSRSTPSVEALQRASVLVRRLRGLIGADALRHGVPGLSRRAAARVKRETLSAMERERKAALTRVSVSQPGVLRGMDAMQVATGDGPRYAMIGADGAVPFRTSVTIGAHYDAALVVRALEADLQRHGAPLVLRLDRASAHEVAAVRHLLDAHHVLRLHGPPHYPSFYGQLERQNREHRAWLEAGCRDAHCPLTECLEQMLEAVNELWPRRTLGWQTAAAVWRSRAPIKIDREQLYEEVKDRAGRIAAQLTARGATDDLAERIAIVRTLELKGYLRLTKGGWC